MAEHMLKSRMCRTDEVLSGCVFEHSRVQDPNASDPWEWPRELMKPYCDLSTYVNSVCRNYQPQLPPPPGRL